MSKKWQKVLFHVQSDFWESGPFTNPGTNQIVTTIGWGQDSDSSSGISSVLREVDVPIMMAIFVLIVLEERELVV